MTSMPDSGPRPTVRLARPPRTELWREAIGSAVLLGVTSLMLVGDRPTRPSLE